MTRPRLIGTFDPGSDAWHEARAHGIGGSEISAVLGLSPFESRFSLWHRKAQLIGPVEETPEMEWGKRHEPTILAKYLEQHPDATPRHPGATWCPQDRPWQIANPDLLIDGAVVEAKTARFDDHWGEPGTDQVPLHYRHQVLWYMDVLELPEAHLVVLIGGCDYREYVVHYDPIEAAELRAGAEDFLESLALQQRPDVDEHSATYEAIKEMHPEIDPYEVELDDDTVARFIAAKANEDQAKAARQLVTSQVADAMGTARKATWEGYTIASRQARGEGTPYVVIGRKLPDPTEITTPTTPTQKAA